MKMKKRDLKKKKKKKSHILLVIYDLTKGKPHSVPKYSFSQMCKKEKMTTSCFKNYELSPPVFQLTV